VESCGYVCAFAKTCLLRGTRKAATNLISPTSKYLDGGKRRSTMVDIFPTFFSYIAATVGGSRFSLMAVISMIAFIVRFSLASITAITTAKDLRQ